jgi:hypothetical protein
MKLPRRLSAILEAKQNYIDSQRTKLENTVVKLQSKLLSDVIKEITPELDIKGGIIQDTPNNYRLISSLDKVYKGFQSEAGEIVLGQMVAGTSKIAELTADYFIAVGGLPEKFEKIIATTNKMMNLRIGLNGGKLVRGGYLESFFNSNTIGLDLKNMTSKAVTSQMNMRDYVTDLGNMITGSEEYKGGLERQFQRYAYDLYQQYDAAYNQTLGNEFGFTYFIYQGGLIDDSRDFCAAHNNKVWSIEEMKTWDTWTPAQGEYPPGYNVKAKDIYSVPSYLGYPGYDPGIDRGGYNCRHALGWIGDILAFEMRPELKEK